MELSRKEAGKFPKEAQDLNTKVVNKIGIEADEVLKKDIELNNAGADKAAQSAADAYASASLMLLIILGAAIIIGVGVSFYLIRDISTGIASIVTPMQALGKGDLTAVVPHQGEKTEIGAMGVATANSVLVISFARERYEVLGDPVAAALEAGFVRFRPVLMTALAMIIGMAPMALGLGEGGEQNAPLGRAVIGGLIFATIATLMFVPVVFSMVHKKQGAEAAAPLETPHVAH